MPTDYTEKSNEEQSVSSTETTTRATGNTDSSKSRTSAEEQYGTLNTYHLTL